MNILDSYHNIKSINERIIKGKTPYSSVNLMKVKGKNFEQMERKDPVLE